MTGRRFIVPGFVLVIAGIAVACSPAVGTSRPSSGPTRDPNVVPVIADMLTYKGDPARLGVHPGPGPEQQPVVLWNVDLPVGGFGVPLVADGLVVAASEDGVVQALDAATGSLAWSVQLPAGVLITPTIDHGTLYLITADGILRTIALDDQAAGWTAPGFLPDSIITVADNLVLAGAPGAIVALDAADGRERWRTDAAGSDRSAVDGETAYVTGNGSGAVRALQLRDGAAKWTFETNSVRALTPGVVDGSVYVAARDVADGQNITYAIGPNGGELWHAAGRGVIGATAVVGDVVFEDRDEADTGVNALARSSGKVLWQRSLAGDLVGGPVVADGVVYVHGIEEGVVAIDAATGDVRWRVSIGSPVEGNFTVSGGLVFVATKASDGTGRVLALADPRDPRVAAAASPTPAPSATETVVPLRILSVDPVEGRSLLLSTAIGPDGTMYVGDMANDRILVRSPDGTIESWGEFGSGDGQFDFSVVTRNDASVGVSVAPDGELIAVGDGGNHRVQVFDANRQFLFSIGRLGREDGQFVNPCCVGVDAEHRIWVVDAGREDVQVFSDTGEHLRTFSRPGRGDGQLSRPVFGDVDEANEEVYIADFGNRRVSIFSTDGTWLRNYGGNLGPSAVLDEVNAVVLDRFGRLLIVDTTSRIFVLDAGGKLVAVIPSRLPEVGQVEFGSLAVDDAGRVYFADIGFGGPGRLIIAQLEPPLWPAE